MYAFNFSTLAPDANYCVSSAHSYFGPCPSPAINWEVGLGTVAPTTAYFHIGLDFYGTGQRDVSYNNITVSP